MFSADEPVRAGPTSRQRVIDIDDVGVLIEEREGLVHVLEDPVVASLTLSDALLLALLRRDSPG